LLLDTLSLENSSFLIEDISGVKIFKPHLFIPELLSILDIDVPPVLGI
jgi:hypothetical protein